MQHAQKGTTFSPHPALPLPLKLPLMKFARTTGASVPQLPKTCPPLQSPPHWEPNVESTTFAPILRTLKAHTQAYINNDFQVPTEFKHSVTEKPKQFLLPACLKRGTIYTGYQTGTDCSGNRQEYRVQVEIKDVDLEASRGCGLLSIFQLTPAYPVLTTYFDAEIIGTTKEFNFSTEGKWGTHSDTD